jgi:hypothetical protein
MDDETIGDYRADYSPLTEAEIAAVPLELEELYRNSVAANTRTALLQWFSETT